MQHPDFELYDNVGRTSEQIAAAHFDIATRDDLLRWARRDAEGFLVEHPLPADPLPVSDAAPYLAALAAAQTPAEVSAVTQHFLDAAQPALSVVSDLLVSIARWNNRHRSAEPGTPSKLLMEAAGRSLSVTALADQADLAVLRDEYDPAPAPPSAPAPKTATGLPPARRPPARRPAGSTHFWRLHLSTHSFIARPTPTGYTGIYVHWDGMPASKLPLLLATFQYRFGRNLDAMAHHLIDDVTIGWAELGTDLLDGAPPEIIAALTEGDRWSSRPLNGRNSPGGPPPTRISVTEATAAGRGLDWGYVLRPHGIEVIPVRSAGAGPVVSWDIDPRMKFSNHPGHWPPSPAATTVITSARPTRAEPRKAARR